MFGIERGRPGRAGDPVIVTDSNTDIGLATALELAAHGFRVFAALRDLDAEPGVTAAAGERGVELEVLWLDPAKPAVLHDATLTVMSEAGGIFGLVTGGSVRLRGALEDSSEEEIRHAFEINVLDTMAAVRAVVPHMREVGRGRIVTVTSAGQVPGYGLTVEYASRFAQEGMAEALALELAPFGIQSIIVAPGGINTRSWAAQDATAAGARDLSSPYYGPFWASEAIADRIVETSPATPADVAASVVTALTAAEPRLRYVVARRAAAVSVLRRHLPERMFERFYYGGQLRRLERLVDPALLPAPSEGTPR